MTSDAYVFNPQTGKYEPATAENEWMVADAKAIAEGKPPPSDKTSEVIAQGEVGLPTAYTGPVVTSGPAVTPASSVPASPPPPPASKTEK